MLRALVRPCEDLERPIDVPMTLHVDHDQTILLTGALHDRLEVRPAGIHRHVQAELGQLHGDGGIDVFGIRPRGERR